MLKKILFFLFILSINISALSQEELSHLMKLKLPARNEVSIIVEISKQKLFVIKNQKVIKFYSVSTSKKGIGSKEFSEKTPLGWHRVEKKIGKGATFGSIFKYRTNTRKIATIPSLTEKDFVTSRIFHLQGLEKGKNKGPEVDSYKRCIYIHGTNEESLIGRPSSRGCIRMRNKDVIDLFEIVKEGNLVYIKK